MQDRWSLLLAQQSDGANAAQFGHRFTATVHDVIAHFVACGLTPSEVHGAADLVARLEQPPRDTAHKPSPVLVAPRPPAPQRGNEVHAPEDLRLPSDVDSFLVGLVLPWRPVPQTVLQALASPWRPLLSGMFGPTSGYDGEMHRLHALTHHLLHWTPPFGQWANASGFPQLAAFSCRTVEDHPITVDLYGGRQHAQIVRLHAYFDANLVRVRLVLWMQGSMTDRLAYLHWASSRDLSTAYLSTNTPLASLLEQTHEALCKGIPTPCASGIDNRANRWQHEQPHLLAYYILTSGQDASLLTSPATDSTPQLAEHWLAYLAQSADPVAERTANQIRSQVRWTPAHASVWNISSTGATVIGHADNAFNRLFKPTLFSEGYLFRWLVATQLAKLGSPQLSDEIERLDKHERRLWFRDIYRFYDIHR